jgi:peroxiredoxin Q/BCP
MTAWLKHQRAAQRVRMTVDPGCFLEHALAARRGEAVDDEAERLPGDVRVDGSQGYHSGVALIEPGQKAPAFALTDQHGKTHRLSDYAGRPVVLYFYPKDDTSGCTKEACAFEANLPRLKSRNAVVLGVSILDAASKAKFADKYDLTFPLLADADHAVAEKYGVWQKRSLYGRLFMGISRTTFLIGGDGKVLKRWDKVKVDGHADQVIEALAAV